MKTTRKFITNLTILILVLTLAMPIQTQAKSIPKLNKKQISLNVKKSYQLKVTGISKKVTWKSSNKKVASVSKKGKVTGKKKGTAVITAKVNKKTYKCKVTVTSAVKVKLNKTKVSLDMAKTKKCQLKLNGTKKKVKWSSNNKKVAAVSNAGMVTAKKKGTAVITAKADKKTYKCKVTVKDTRKKNPPKNDTEEEKKEETKYTNIHPIKKDKDGYYEGPRYQCTCGTPIHADIKGEWERHVWFFCEAGSDSAQDHQLIPIKEYRYPNICCSCGLCFYVGSFTDNRMDGWGMHDTAWSFYEEFNHGKPGHIHEDPPINGGHSCGPICPYTEKHGNCPYH